MWVHAVDVTRASHRAPQRDLRMNVFCVCTQRCVCVTCVCVCLCVCPEEKIRHVNPTVQSMSVCRVHVRVKVQTQTNMKTHARHTVWHAHVRKWDFEAERL